MQLINVFPAIILPLLALTESAKKVEVKETSLDSAVADIQWLGDNQRTVLVQTKRGRLYRSTNGGETWNDITEKFVVDSADGRSIVVDKMIKSPASPDTILVAGTRRSHFLSTNGGETWRRLKQKATIHTFLFHKKRSKWALLSTWTDACETRPKTKKKKSKKSDDDDDGGDNDDGKDEEADEEPEGPCSHILYITKDMGRTFTQVASYVVQFSWGDASHDQEDRIYFSHFRQKKGDQQKLHVWSENVDFACTDNAGRTVSRLLYMGNKFLVTHGFIMAVKLKDRVSQTVNLMISSDGGGQFKQAKLAEEIDEKSYIVLDTSEGVIILHVNHGDTEGSIRSGNVYISDKEGIRYTLSLANNVRGAGGDCEFDKVISLDGIYLANIKEPLRPQDPDGSGKKDKKAEDAKEGDELESESTGTAVEKRHTAKAKSKDETVVRTVITLDKGGVWSYLKPPRVDSTGKQIDCPPDRCWLHMHGVTNFQNYAPFYSTENAIGIIMGTGNVGPNLRFEPDQTNTYLSRDGGLTWVEVHKGAFIYEFGDHGGLIVMADDIKKTKQVVFSWNEGTTWYDFEVSEYPMEVDNVVTEPNATSTKFLLYGTRGDSGVVYHLNFDHLGQPVCKGVWAADSVSSDYETWSPSDGSGSEKCMLGRQVTYTRRKQTSECFNGERFERPVAKKNCPCTEKDFECEMGFARKVGSMECVFTNDGSIPIPPRCKSEDDFRAVSHRKVVGNGCEGGWRPQKAVVQCPRTAKLTKGAASMLGSVAMVGTIMGAIFFLSKSEKVMTWFANNGFQAFGSVKYSTIGALAPETALESVGSRDEFGSDQDDFVHDAPSTTRFGNSGALAQQAGGGGGARELRDSREQEMRPESVRRIDTAAEQVPKLQKPPSSANTGAAAAEDDSVDLL
mmetsp:Transcript_24086/g.75500  ORF Transcript_24086/g.75500 Transcript_24086/m.75500 type:complete len:904 (+) Transcript_24086:63-2774(+)